MRSSQALDESPGFPWWCGIPPAGACPPISALSQSFVPLLRFGSPEKRRQAFEQEIARELDVSDAVLYSSGKAALCRLLRAFRVVAARDTVLVASYTCPDVATAALSAGYRVVALPVDRESLDFEFGRGIERFDPARSVLILSNLYGLSDRLAPWASLREEGLIVIDDACQALRSGSREGEVGRRRGTFGVVSFGRGKALSGIGGGAVILPEDIAESCDKHGIDKGRFTSLLRGGSDRLKIREVLRDLFLLSASGFATHRAIYPLVRKLPGLHIGETRVNFTCLESVPSLPALVVARAALFQFEATMKLARERARELATLLKPLPVLQPFERRKLLDEMIAPSRFPVIVHSVRVARRLLLSSEAIRLGVSCSYPQFLGGYELLQGRIESLERDGDDLPQRVVTLPVHPAVTTDAVRRIVRIVEVITAEAGGNGA